MNNCKCGFSTDIEKQCNGTHKIVKKIRNRIAKEIENIPLENGNGNSQLNALGMRIIAASVARGKNV
jgi:hypothetical protein